SPLTFQPWADVGLTLPRESVRGFIVTTVRNCEFNSVEGLLECRHHREDDIFMVMLLHAREIQIGGKPPPAAHEHFAQAGASLEGEPVEKAALGEQLQQE